MLLARVCDRGLLHERTAHFRDPPAGGLARRGMGQGTGPAKFWHWTSTIVKIPRSVSLEPFSLKG